MYIYIYIGQLFVSLYKAQTWEQYQSFQLITQNVRVFPKSIYVLLAVQKKRERETQWWCLGGIRDRYLHPVLTHFIRALERSWKADEKWSNLSLRLEEQSCRGNRRLTQSWKNWVERGGGGDGGGGDVGIVITSDKHAVVFNYQVFTLLPRTSISRTPKNLTHTLWPHAIN